MRVLEDAGCCYPRGFLAAGVNGGIKPPPALDMALVVAEKRVPAAGVFTRNRAAAAPVRISRDRVASGGARGVIINSGCANALTGARGEEDAEATATFTASLLECPAEDMLVCSTGLIGSLLPMAAVFKGASLAVRALGPDDSAAAAAILTTDTRPKRAAVDAGGWRVGGMAKGAGMIAPDMATMLAVLTTDAQVPPDLLQAVLAEAAAATFNSITIDGDTSTNDTALALAGGASGREPGKKELLGAFMAVCESLAEAIVADAEGATRLVRVRIEGAADASQAARAARAVAQSLLVKTALHGADANWGRVAAAVGRSGADADFGAMTISMGGVTLFESGVPAGEDRVEQARRALSDKRVEIRCDLGVGDSAAEMLTSDLSPEYVRINAAYEKGGLQP